MGVLDLEHRIEVLSQLGERLKAGDDFLEASKVRAEIDNPWYTKAHIDLQISNFVNHYLDKDALKEWVSQYDINSVAKRKKVGVIMAGNIPLVGFHDLLCAYILGDEVIIKLSDKDKVLMPAVLRLLREIDPEIEERIQLTDRLESLDLLLATGSNNTQRYFEYYFKDTPKLLRNSRNGIAIISDQTTDVELEGLVDDVFLFFGLGCRSVSKLFVPRNFDFNKFFNISLKYKYFANHAKYKNNFDYNAATFLLNRIDHLTNDLIILREEKEIASRIGCLHYEYYDDIQQISDDIGNARERIQCIATNLDLGLGEDVAIINLGKTQYPSLSQYADGKDTIDFLINNRPNDQKR